jgi:hypothetical protein
MSFVQVRPRTGSGNQSSLAVDRTPFYGARVPDEVKQMIKAVKSMEAPQIKPILKFVVEELDGRQLETDAFLLLASEKCSEEKLRVVFSGLMTLIRMAIRQPSLKSEMLKEDLSQLKLSGELITDINSVVFGKRRSTLCQSSLDQSVRLPQLASLKWRIDVTISNSSLNRVLEPSVLLEMTLSDGSIKTFEVKLI